MHPPEQPREAALAGAPEVSVLVANFNNGPYLAPALDSALAQKVDGLEVIVVDDGSTDDSLAVIKAAQAKAPGVIRLFETAGRQGPGAARNRALREARGRWLAVLDGDDLMQPGRLRGLIDRATAAGADMIADDLELFYQDGDKAPHRHLGAGYDGYDRPIDVVGYIGENHFYAKRPTLGYLKPVWRADRWRALGILYNPDLKIGEDYDFMVRMLRGGLRFMIAPSAGYRYRRHSSSISHRIGNSQLHALIEADEQLRASLTPRETALAQVLRVRRSSIEDGLAYDAVIQALKARAALRALWGLLARPRITPLLWEPVAVRLRRLRARLGKRS